MHILLTLFENSYFLLFFIIFTGTLIGKISLKGFTLNASAVLFVALLLGHMGYWLPADFQKIGLVFFIFTIGIQNGAGFFESFKERGAQAFIVVAAIFISGAGAAVGLSYALSIDPAMAVGLFTGALTSTPGLAAAIESTGSPLASIGYGIAYPFGVIGVILFVRLLPRLLNIDLQDELRASSEAVFRKYPEVLQQNYVVENAGIEGKSIGRLKIQSMTGANISRVKHGPELIVPTARTILHTGDLVKAVGTPDALEKVEVLLGKKVDLKIPLDKQNESRLVLVTNKHAVNKTLAQLNLQETCNATITRIRRSGIDISPGPDSVIKFGDKLMVVCSKEEMKIATKILGNEVKRLSETDFLPVAAGITLGIALGSIELPFFGLATFRLGLTGGVLITALVLSYIGKTGPIIWTLSGASNQALRKLGLLLFLATVGTNAGKNLAQTLTESGLQLILSALLITALPMILAVLVGRVIFKVPFLTFLGILTGGMTSTPGLSAANSIVDSDDVNLAYATVYPIALAMMILSTQLLGQL
ncbi:MAG: transporter [Chitinivibrionales bacterium]|nr:transporter [Chitinivibrionales bacterium]